MTGDEKVEHFKKYASLNDINSYHPCRFKFKFRTFVVYCVLPQPHCIVRYVINYYCSSNRKLYFSIRPIHSNEHILSRFSWLLPFINSACFWLYSFFAFALALSDSIIVKLLFFEEKQCKIILVKTTNSGYGKNDSFSQFCDYLSQKHRLLVLISENHVSLIEFWGKLENYSNFE